MKIGLYVLNIFCFVLISCGDDKKTSEVVDAERADQQITITAKAISDFEYTDYGLSEESDATVANWEKYKELAIQINYLKKADVSFFKDDKEALKKFINEFKAEIPKQLTTNPIKSRVAILETTLLKLNDNLSLDNIDGSVQLLTVKEVLEAFSNLNYQINKKLEGDMYDKIQPE